jgi:hypothetical protein
LLDIGLTLQVQSEVHPIRDLDGMGFSGLPQSFSSFSTTSWASQPCLAPANDAPGSTPEQEKAAGAASSGGADAVDDSKASASAKQKSPEAQSAESKEIDASKEELVQMLAEREVSLDEQGQQIKDLQDKVLRTLAEMENLRERTAREAENMRKFAIQVRADMRTEQITQG